MLIQRKDFLQNLLMVSPGLSKKEVLQQSGCIVFRKGRMYTLSQEIACSLPSGLAPEVECAVRAENLIELLKRLPEDELELTHEVKTLNIKGKGRKAKITLEAEILLPIDEVELPKKDSWQPLHENFAEAVDLVQRCTRKKDNFTFESIHICSTYMEAGDDIRRIAMRYTVPTFIEKECLVRGETIKCIVQLGMTKGTETDSWLHFHNPIGLRLSIRKFSMEPYPSMDQLLAIRGKRVVFPKGLQEAAERAGLFTEDGDAVKISVSDDKLVIEGKNVTGEYREGSKLKYKGDPISFYIPAKLIQEIAKDHSECEITSCSLRAEGSQFVYCSSLMMMENGNGNC